jgi:DNA-3-methyladenine glycosylase II
LSPARARAAAREKANAEGEAHLRRADPVLGALIEANGPLGPVIPAAQGRYAALVRAIVGQQLSVKAAVAINQRLVDQFAGREPTPAELLAIDPDVLRTTAGLSRAKTTFLRSLAEHVVSGALDLDGLDALDDDAVVAELRSVKGIGLWTAHVFLMFQLGRPDVLPVGDLGIRRAVERAYELAELPGAPELEAIAQPWRPYRSLAARHLWQSLENAPFDEDED